MTDSPLDPFTPALEIAAAIRNRTVSPVEVMEVYLDQVDRLDGDLNAFCHRADDDARRDAAKAAQVVMTTPPEELPPFHGVPMPIKDLIDVAGWPTTYGSTGASPAPAPVSSPVVRRFVDGGFVLMGKTTTSEFGAISFTESDAHGITRNPWDTARTPGGSSGGAAVAVASGMAPIAHAADGGGSIRVPASCTGLVGLKPTRGRVTDSYVDVEGLGTNGVVTRSVADSAAALDVMARHDPAAWWSPPAPLVPFADALETAPPSGLRVGVIADAPVEGIDVDPACKAAVERTLASLETQGHQIVEKSLPLPPTEVLVATFTTIWNTAGATVPLADPDSIQAHNQALREAARGVDSWSYVQAVERAERMSRLVVEAFVADFDLLVTPTMACLPPPVESWRAGTEDSPLMALLNCYPLAVFTSLFNVTGLPAISVPLHHDPVSDLPVGVQIAARPWREDLLLRVARSLEEEHRWLERRPVL